MGRPRLPDTYQEAYGVKVGDQIGRWEVLALGWTRGKRRRRVALVRCSCCGHTERVVDLHGLAKRDTRSCGCLSRELKPSLKAVIDGYQLSQHPLYNVWVVMLQRCYTETNPSYAANGGRGIGVYPAWRKDSAAFIRWVEDNLGPRQGYSRLVRIDPDKDYEPGNLMWRVLNRRAALPQDRNPPDLSLALRGVPLFLLTLPGTGRGCRAA